MSDMNVGLDNVLDLDIVKDPKTESKTGLSQLYGAMRLQVLNRTAKGETEATGNSMYYK